MKSDERGLLMCLLEKAGWNGHGFIMLGMEGRCFKLC